MRFREPVVVTESLIAALERQLSVAEEWVTAFERSESISPRYLGRSKIYVPKELKTLI